jgi:hypothetical protein
MAIPGEFRSQKLIVCNKLLFPTKCSGNEANLAAAYGPLTPSIEIAAIILHTSFSRRQKTGIPKAAIRA